MPKQTINLGTTANDNTGDTLRAAGTKINANFDELYARGFAEKVRLFDSGVGGIEFEGASANNFETQIRPTEPTQDNVITLPDSTGTVVLQTTVDTLHNKTIVNPVLVHTDIYDSVGAANYYELVPPTAAGMTKNINLNIPTLTDSDTLVTNTSTSTLTNKTINYPTVHDLTVNRLLDSNGAVSMDFVATSSAVNHFQFTNGAGASTSEIIMEPAGTAGDIDLTIRAKGSGTVNLEASFSYKDSNYDLANVALPGTAGVHYLNATTTMALLIDDGERGQVIQVANVNNGTVNITKSAGATYGFTPQGDSANAKVYVAPGGGFTAVYSPGDGTGKQGWFILGCDSDKGIGDRVHII